MEVINTNISSLIIQNNLSASQNALQNSMTQLSSGLRINSAADDAAGLAIATGFTTQINGLNQGILNANDGLSLAQTAGGALSAIPDNLQRIRQLAVEAANATQSATNRQQINQEVQQRLQEITRVATQTNFNGQNVLDGTFGEASFQIGANVGQTITVGLTQGVKATQMGSIATVSSGYGALGANGVTGGGDLTMTLADGSTATVAASSNFVGSDTYHGASSAYAVAGAINGSNLQGVTAVAVNNQAYKFTAVTTDATLANNATASYSLSINGVNVLSNSYTNTTGSSLTSGVALASGQDVVNAVNANSSLTGVTASFDAKGNLVLSSADGGNIDVTETQTNTAANQGTGAATAGTDSSVHYNTAGLTSGTAATLQGEVTVYSQQAITIGGSTPADAGLTAGTTAIDTSKTLANQDVLTVADANQTMLAVDAALSTINNLQATLGAVQNRFTSAISNQQNTVQNLTQARSRIQDADFASATAAMSRAQVLQQAGIGVLAQANQMPQLALKLIP